MASIPGSASYMSASYFSAVPVQSSNDAMRDNSPDGKKEINRKRPKYTRSKMGCLTCRTKKVKCDEIKPICTRCVQSQRECTWPDVVPPRKKGSSKKSSDERPSTADSERLSSSSSPPLTREQSPRSRNADLGFTLPPRSHDLSLQMPNSSAALMGHRRINNSHSYMPPSHHFPSPTDPVLHPIPELQHPYSSHNGNLNGHSLNHATSHHAYYSPTSASSAVSHASSIPRQHESILPPLDLSRFPGPPVALTSSQSWHAAPMLPLDSDSYVRQPNLVGRAPPHSTMYSVPYYTAKESDGAILQPVRVW